MFGICVRSLGILRKHFAIWLASKTEGEFSFYWIFHCCYDFDSRVHFRVYVNRYETYHNFFEVNILDVCTAIRNEIRVNW